jgi:hypothetical protein
MSQVSLSDATTIATSHARTEAAFVAQMSEPTLWRPWYGNLPRAVRGLLDRVRRAGGRMPMSVLLAMGGPLRTNFDTLSPRTLLSIHDPLSPLEQLFVQGAIWPSQRDWVIPADVEAVLPDQEPLFAAAMTTVRQLDVPPSLDEMLIRLALLAHDGRLAVQQHGRVSHAVAQRIQAPVVYVQWLVACCVAGGALHNQHNRYHTTVVMRDWLALSSAHRAQEIARAWLQAAWSEWEMIPKRKSPVLDVRQSRRIVLQALLSHVPETWCDIDEMLTCVRLGWPDVMRPLGADVRWQVPAGWPATWYADDGQLLRSMLLGPLQWLGMIESADEGHALRRSALGSWFAGLAAAPHESPVIPAVLERDFSVIIMDQRNLWARFQLYRIGTYVDESTVQLAPTTLKKAVAQGMSVPEYIDILTHIVGGTLPSAMLTTIQSWAEEVVHVQLRHASMLTCADMRIINDICAHSRIARLDIERLNDTTVKVAWGQAAECMKILRECGYVVDGDGLRWSLFSQLELTLLEQGLKALPTSPEIQQLRQRMQHLRRREES